MWVAAVKRRRRRTRSCVAAMLRTGGLVVKFQSRISAMSGDPPNGTSSFVWVRAIENLGCRSVTRSAGDVAMRRGCRMDTGEILAAYAWQKFVVKVSR